MKRIASGFLPLISIDRKIAKPLHRQIYDAYRNAIAEGRLVPNQQVPSTRVTATELGISRFPVLNAYAQLLEEGYFESKIGVGTVVCKSLPDRIDFGKASEERLARFGSGSRQVAGRVSNLPAYKRSLWLGGSGAFSVGQVAFDEFPLPIWTALVARHCRNMTARSFLYGDAMGSLPLREAIASYLRTSRAVQCKADQVMIVGGSQEALEISATVLFDTGSSIWVEEPGYRFGTDAFALAGCNLVPVSVDKDGLNVARGIELCPDARAAIITPSHQFPLGVTMSAQRRLELLNWAAATGSWVIEDDYDSEFRYDCAPIASLQGLDVNDRVLYVGTFSKVLFPSLRLGYIVIPPDLASRFITVRHAMGVASPSFHQDVLADFIIEGHFARHIRRMRTLYQNRREVLIANVQEQFGPLATVIGSAAGMCLTVTLPKGTNDRRIAKRAALEKLWVWPLSTTYLGERSRPGFILGFGSTSAKEIPNAVRRLRKLMDMK
jgi:GntR family transcriptional regulator/MocR family aminotransferase